MDRVSARLAGRADVLGRLEVGGDLDGLVRRARVQRPGVVGRDHGDRAEAELPRGAEDAQGDLPAVCDEHLLHGAELTGTVQPGVRRARLSTTSVATHTPESTRYGTASLVACASAPPPAAPIVCPGAHARLISAAA